MEENKVLLLETYKLVKNANNIKNFNSVFFNDFIEAKRNHVF